MKALRLNEHNKIELREEPEPIVGQGECLLGVTAVGICGSDLLWLNQGNIGDARIEKSLILGHEFAGIIESGGQKGSLLFPFVLSIQNYPLQKYNHFQLRAIL